MMMANSDELVTLKHGYVVDAAVVRLLLSLEGRGARFELKPDGGFRVIPPSVLTQAERVFLRAHRDQARRVLEYQVEDSHYAAVR
jgi:hypothetical protein